MNTQTVAIANQAVEEYGHSCFFSTNIVDLVRELDTDYYDDFYDHYMVEDGSYWAMVSCFGYDEEDYKEWRMWRNAAMVSYIGDLYELQAA